MKEMSAACHHGGRSQPPPQSFNILALKTPYAGYPTGTPWFSRLLRYHGAMLRPGDTAWLLCPGLYMAQLAEIHAAPTGTGNDFIFHLDTL